MLVGAIAVQTATAPGQTVGVSAFVDHLVRDLDLTRSAVSTAYLIGTLAGALTMTTAGRLIDRRGVRWALGAFGAGFGLILVAMSGVTGFLTLALGFAGTRILGQGALTLTASTAVAVSFDRRRGTATGLLSGIGGSLMSLVPLLATLLIAQVGWRMTWVLLAMGVWAVVLPLAATQLFARRPLPAHEQPVGATAGRGWTTREALRTRAFWVVALAVGHGALVATGLAFHHIDLLTAQGLTSTQAAANFLPQTLFGAGAALLTGRLADRVSPRLLLPGAVVLVAAAPLAVHLVRPGLMAIGYGAILGAGMTSIRAVEGTVLPRWFGTAHIGEIRGVTMAATVAGSAIGPLPLALTSEHLGSYTPALVIFSAVAVAIAGLAAATRPPRSRGGDVPTPDTL